MSMTAEVVFPNRSYLGEGALWDEKREVLWYVDITRGHLHEAVPGGKDITYNMGRMIGTVALTAGREMIVALEDGICLFHPATQHVRFLIQPIPHDLSRDMRFNDGKCDPAGRFWVGSLCKKPTKKILGSLYRMEDLNTAKAVLHGFSTPNGMGWSPDHKTMYFIDTPAREVYAYDYNLQTGDLQNRRSAAKIPEGEGGPDGMTVDAEGMLWVAQWGGWQVGRYDPVTGEKIGQVKVPAERVTSCAFGGRDLDTLFITTAGGDREDKAQPMAGAVFACKPGVKGVASYRFGTA